MAIEQPHNRAMQEIEIKFQIPAGQAPALREALRQAGAAEAPLPLHAAYFDTPGKALARHKMALRVRREGSAWVQTFKAAGQDAMTRVEDNQPCPAPVDGRVAPDLGLHTAAPVREALARAWEQGGGAPGEDLAALAQALEAMYETRFDRWACTVRTPHGRVMVCLDLGDVIAGGLREPLAELEFELIDGQPRAMIELARQWVDRHGLWLDVQSKAYRGTRLARAWSSGQPAPAEPVVLDAKAVALPLQPGTPQIHAALSACLDALAGNWSEVAALRPGWPRALEAWHDALGQGLRLAHTREGVRQALAEPAWEGLQGLQTRLREHLAAPSPQAAQALACSPGVTHGGLDLLAALAPAR